jgi:2-polyprenyl-3-methyl-5-hydroxy-6-metoxy-1,4-benzoquinol methylase
MNNRTPIINQKYEEFRLKKMYDLVCQYSNYKKNVSVADLGFAHWPNRYLINDKNLVVTGIDIVPNKTELKYTNELVMDLTKDLTHLKKYDVILAGEIIEHMENPYHFLRNIKNLAHAGTILILSTPNILNIPTLFFEYLNSEKYFFSKDHTYYFSPRWLKRMLELTGWNLLSKQGTGLNLILIRFKVPFVFSNHLIYISSPVVTNKKNENVYKK